jgi:hypothetical protein
MTKTLLLLTASLMFVACGKEPPIELPPVSTHPQMAYRDLGNKEVKYGQYQKVDIDNDGTEDFRFSVLLLGDPILQRDRMQFYANSNIKRNLLNNQVDESPMLHKGDSIALSHPGYKWWEISSIVLVEKIIDNNGDHWEGLWKNADHQYLPVQVEKNGKLFHGWIELSFDTIREVMILHKSAISTEENKTVKAGI